MQRKSTINGSLFLNLIVFNSESLKVESLNDLCGQLKDDYGIDIGKQSLNERFNEKAVTFLKMALEKMLQDQMDDDLSLPSLTDGIERILLKDSVCFQIDESLAEYYKGSGGSGSGASIRIQFEYDLLTGKINDLSVNAFNEQDASDSVATMELTTKGDLIIRDLAYMNLTPLKLIAKNLAYYLCRLNPRIKVFELKGDIYEIVSFKKIRTYMRRHNLKLMEKEVYIGDIEKLKVRLIIHLLPSEVVAERLRKARINAKKKGRGKLSKEYIARSYLNLFLTNASEEQIPAENVWPLYRLRWQIELIFKIWKSICKIDKVKKVKIERLECYIFSKLIFIVLGWQITWKIAKHLFIHESKAFSFFKAFKTLYLEKIKELRDIFVLRKSSLEAFMKKFYDRSRTHHLVEKRKQEPTSLEILLGCITHCFC